MTSYLIDVVILSCLSMALVWGVVLARRIARLQSALMELAPALQMFCDAVDQSERSVDEIRRETDRLATEAERIASGRLCAPSASAVTMDRSDLVRRFFASARSKEATR